MTPAPIENAVSCPYCLSIIAHDESRFECPDCLTAYHQECWEELGGCATYGCARMVEVRKSGGEDVSFWGQTEKTCPMCAETISLAALECPFCHAPFDDIKPIERKDLFADSAPAEPRMRKRATKLFIFSILGVPSPITLLIGLIWYGRRKKELASDASARAFVLISILISALYIILILGGWALFALQGQPAGEQTP